MFLRKATVIAASMLMLLVFIKINGDVSSFIATVKNSDATTVLAAPLLTEEDKLELYNTIVQHAESSRVPPVDARIDRVWRAIPGYNGLEVDIEKTYQETLASPRGSGITYRYKEVEPRIGLQQLGAQPIYRGNPDKNMISFMINVAWGNEFLPGILETLERENVKATFFLDGSWLAKNVELAEQIAAKGHELSNHAYSHPDMAALSRSEQYKQISRTETLLKEKLDVKNQWFAPPSGSFNGTTVQVAREMGLYTVLWTIDTIDWKKPSPESIVAKIDRKLEPGALILMHPTASSSEALPGMIAAAKRKGYGIGTVGETLSSARMAPNVEGIGRF